MLNEAFSFDQGWQQAYMIYYIIKYNLRKSDSWTQ